MAEAPFDLTVAQRVVRLLHTTTAPVVYISALSRDAERHARAVGIPQRRVWYVNRADKLRGLRGPLVVIELDSAHRIRAADRDEILYRVDMMRATGSDVVHLVEGSPEERAVVRVLTEQLAAAHHTRESGV